MQILGISGLHNSVNFRKTQFPSLPKRQHRLAPGHDSAAAIVTPTGVLAAAAEERFTRIKGTGDFPVNAIRYCLAAANLTPDQVDFIAHGFDFEPYRSFYEQYDEATRAQYKQVYSRDLQLEYLNQSFPEIDWDSKLIQVPHHIAHAASAFFLSGFDESLILVTDGMGELHSATVAVGQGSNIKVIKQVPSLHSLGILYGVVTLYLGFEFGFDEYKVMGLAPYGNPRRFFHHFMEFIKLRDDGTYTIPLLFENKTFYDKLTYNGTLQTLNDTFGPAREPESDITQHHMDIAAGLQSALQATLLHTLSHFQRETGQKNICMAGGVALNCTANGLISKSKLFTDMFVQPASADDGTSVGAALYVQSLHAPMAQPKRMGLPLWGPEFDEDSIGALLGERNDCRHTHFAVFDELAEEVARRLADGQIIAWFQGRMEFGPRALGSRSLLADPRDPGMRDHLNSLVKKREGFRPFAPAVIAEAAAEYFEVDSEQLDRYIYMLYVTQTRAEYQQQLPAITHVDGSARVQVVRKDQQPRFWTMLSKFGDLTGIPVLVNTSFNVRGQPIVCTPTEALDTFLSTKIDALVLGSYLVTHV